MSEGERKWTEGNRGLNTQYNHEETENTWGTELRQIRHDDTRTKPKLTTLNMEHKTFTIKQEMNECKTDT